MGNLTDKQLARAVHSVKFMQDYGSMVSSSNSANQSSGAWISHMVEWIKKDPKRFTKRPMKEYLDDEQAPKFLKFLGRVFSMTRFCHGKKMTNNDKIVLEKQKIFTKALAKINFEKSQGINHE